jgi:uncharacterized protein (DUF305 family)
LTFTRPTARFLLGFTALTAASAAFAQPPVIVQPGAPGQPSRTLPASEATRVADTRFTAADVKFMQDMIWHHSQAVEMSALVRDRTRARPLIDVSGRITSSQAAEIRFMRTWLTSRDLTAPDPAAAGGHADHSAHNGMAHAAHVGMPGMATAAQMTALAAARGAEFDRLFLERMIDHHQGAITMVRDLLSRGGSAYDPTLFDYANEVVNEQQAEIDRMSVLLAGIAADPRATLRPGFRDAGQAISNMTLVASLPRPAGFFDPNNPSDVPPTRPARPATATEPARPAGRIERTPLFSFAQTDMAFSGDLLATGNYHGFNLYRLGADPAAPPRLITSVVCPGGQGDLSIVGNLLIMSVEQNRGRTDCGLQGNLEDVTPNRFRGIRIFDISDPALPRQVGQVQTCRGSHTHSVVSSDARNIIVYVSGTSGVRRSEELAGCNGAESGDNRTSLFRIDVIEIPVADPSRARIVDSPAVFADAETGRLAGLWQGGRREAGAQNTSATDQCHDITVFPSRRLAAGACSGNGIIFDISDPRRPRRLDAAFDPNFAYWHSATFNNDGTKVLFTDEWGGGGQPRCRAQDPANWGANAIYDIVDGRLVFRAHYKLAAIQTEEENCVAHNGSIVPVPGRDIFVQAWYQGGISVIDFTDSANVREIAYFDRGPIDGEHMVLGGFWSAYWYNGRIYGTEIARGLDVLTLAPSAHLTANEIEAARLASQTANGAAAFNPQQQFPVSWPAHPAVALAYLDQLQRSNALPAATAASLTQALGQARGAITAGRRDGALARRLDGLARGLPEGTADDGRRITALRETLRGIATRLR